MNYLADAIDVLSVINPGGLSAGATNIADVDVKDGNSAVILLSMGVIGGLSTNTATLTLRHGQELDQYEPVTANDVTGVDGTITSGVVLSIVAANNQAGVYKIGYVGGKRYLDATLTLPTGASVDASCLVVTGGLALTPPQPKKSKAVTA